MRKGILKNKPRKFSTQYEHNLYGIVSHLDFKYNLNQEEAKEMIRLFIESKGEWKPIKNKKKNRRARLNYIQNRFSEFCTFVSKTLKEQENERLDTVQ